MESFLEAVESVENDGCEGPTVALADIQSAMEFLLEKAEEVIPKGLISERAKSYWIAQIKVALKNDSEYLGKSMVTMDDTIEEVEDVEREAWED